VLKAAILARTPIAAAPQMGWILGELDMDLVWVGWRLLKSATTVQP